jgi:hypothetical protein
MGACGSHIDSADSSPGSNSRSISVPVQGRRPVPKLAHPIAPQTRTRVSWNTRPISSGGGAQWTDPLPYDATPTTSGLHQVTSDVVHMHAPVHHSRSGSHLAYHHGRVMSSSAVSVIIDERNTRQQHEHRKSASVTLSTQQALQQAHMRRGSTDVSTNSVSSSGAQVNSYTPRVGAEPIDCTEIEEYYMDDNLEYQEYVRKWEASREAEMREHLEQPGGRSLFFGLELLQRQQQLLKTPPRPMPHCLPPCELQVHELAMADEILNIDFPASTCTSPRPMSPIEANRTPTPALTRFILPRAMPSNGPVFAVPHIAQSSLIAFMQELLLSHNSTSVAGTRLSSPLLGPQPGLLTPPVRHAGLSIMVHPRQLSPSTSFQLPHSQSMSPLPVAKMNGKVVHRRRPSAASTPFIFEHGRVPT